MKIIEKNQKHHPYLNLTRSRKNILFKKANWSKKNSLFKNGHFYGLLSQITENPNPLTLTLTPTVDDVKVSTVHQV